MFTCFHGWFNYMKILPLFLLKHPDMSEKRILPVLALILALLLPTVMSAQVPVEVSNEKMVYGGKVFYVHHVQKGQTLYSISRAYKVTIDAITRDNVIPSSGIQTGQVLRIPSAMQVSEVPVQPRQAAQPAQRSAGTTSPTVAVSPAVDAATGIRLARERIMYNGKAYYMHEVLKGQTLYSIARAYKVTILDIDRENAIPAGGLQAGQILRIPASSSLVVTEKESDAAATSQPRNTVKAATTQKPADNQAVKSQGSNAEVKNQPAGNRQAVTTTQTSPAAGQNEVTTQTSPAAGQNEAKTQTNTATRQNEATSQTPAPVREPAAKQVQPEKKRIHKVQKGESLADIAQKYGITIQELKRANKGVIFAMPDMRLVIPVSGDSQ